jgi:aldehyde:ferredoxin oxidoreductase
VGERGYTLERELGLRFGNGGALGDTLPRRLLEEPQDSRDPTSVVPLAALKRDYYRQRGWDADGRPKARLLARLGIEGRTNR